ncbi:hypothetical protein [Thermoactinospora rubra]|uniref:hypothetical protein n=1 Tax=Thermoactinospora rubra TaxID=1088767 RepID=UPI001F0B0CF1|nr:hypothetical protein [Thermoactinospora rubra]
MAITRISPDALHPTPGYSQATSPWSRRYGWRSWPGSAHWTRAASWSARGTWTRR